MIPVFSRAMDYPVESQFRKEPSRRLVFLPLGPRKKRYFVDAKPEEEKIRSFLKLWRNASALTNLLLFPGVYLLVSCDLLQNSPAQQTENRCRNFFVF